MNNPADIHLQMLEVAEALSSLNDLLTQPTKRMQIQRLICDSNLAAIVESADVFPLVATAASKSTGTNVNTPGFTHGKTEDALT